MRLKVAQASYGSTRNATIEVREATFPLDDHWGRAKAAMLGIIVYEVQ